MWIPASQRTAWANRVIEEHLEHLVHAFVRRPLVMMFETGSAGEFVGLGSGTLVRAGSGRAAILTARHVVEDAESLHALASNGAFRDVVANVRMMPGDVDIALVETTTAAESMDDVAIDADLLADVDAPVVAKGDTVVAVGFPEQVTATVFDDVRGRALHRHGDMIHRTVVAGVDLRALSLVWTEGEILERSPHVYETAGFPRSGLFNHKMPRGISGGAVWKQNREHIEVWTVESVFRLVGVLHEFKNRRQLAVPARRWSRWVKEQLASL